MRRLLINCLDVTADFLMVLAGWLFVRCVKLDHETPTPNADAVERILNRCIGYHPSWQDLEAVRLVYALNCPVYRLSPFMTTVPGFCVVHESVDVRNARRPS